MLNNNNILSSLLRIPCSIFSPAGNHAKLTILTYHRVLPAPDPLIRGEVVQEDFELHMRVLSQYFNAIPLQEAAEGLKKGKLPSRAVCVTFDDGYADNADVALPILTKWNIPATFFIAVGFLDSGRMWNDTVIESIREADGLEISLQGAGLGTYDISNDEARRIAIKSVIDKFKYLSFDERADKVQALYECVDKKLNDGIMMTSEQVLQLKNSGMEIGAHTINHPILTRLSKRDAEKEILDGCGILQEITGDTIRSFAYPNGRPGKDYNYQHVEILKRAGIKVAVTTACGYGRKNDDLLQLPRITQWSRSSFGFSLRILRNYISSTPDQLAS